MFNIPYRTVTEWKEGTRNAPDYVLRLLAYYYIKMENMVLKIRVTSSRNMEIERSGRQCQIPCYTIF